MSSKIGIEISATDTASDKVRGVADTTTAALERVKDKSKEVDAANTKLKSSALDVVTGLSGVATSAFALYNGFDRLQTIQLTADKANLSLQRSQEAVKKAQEDLTEAVTKYGPESSEAAASTKKLELAQQALSIAQERAEITQDNVGQAQMGFALSIVPTSITALKSLHTAYDGIKSAQELVGVASSGLSKALSFMAANPIVLVITAIAALVAGLIWAYQNCEPFRNAVNAIAKALSDFFKPILDAVIGAVTWFWNLVKENPILGLLSPITAVIAIMSHWQEIIDAVTGAFKWLSDAIGGAWDWITGKTKSATAEVKSSISSLTSGVAEDFAILNEAVIGKSSWADMWDKVEGRLQSAVGPITGQIGTLTTSVKTSFSDMAETVESLWGGTVGVIEEGGLKILDMRDKVETAAAKITEAATEAYYIAEGYQKAIALGYQTQAQAWETQKQIAVTYGSLEAYQKAVYAGTAPIWGAQYGFTGMVGSPTLFLAGEKGPEYVSITPSGKGSGINIQGPLVQILGSADRSTAELAARLVEERLRNVLVEASSASAPATHKRIRLGSVI